MGPVLLLVRDLLLASRVRVGLGQAGVVCSQVRDPNALAAAPAAPFLVVDLNLEGAIAAASAYQARTGAKTLGFVSHADAHTVAQARQAGISRVLARSTFLEDPAKFLAG